jgi:hypothetical protein
MVSPVRTQIGDWLNELFLIEQDVRLRLEPLTEEQFTWRPGPGKWSVAECLDHLATATTLMLGKVRPALERARVEGLTGDEGPCAYGWLGRKFVALMETPGKRALPAPRNFIPASGLVQRAVLDKFAGAMGELRDTLDRARGVALDRVKARSAAAGGGWIRLNLAAWFAATLAHGRRHVAQAARVITAPAFPAAPPAS